MSFITSKPFPDFFSYPPYNKLLIRCLNLAIQVRIHNLSLKQIWLKIQSLSFIWHLYQIIRCIVQLITILYRRCLIVDHLYQIPLFKRWLAHQSHGLLLLRGLSEDYLYKFLLFLFDWLLQALLDLLYLFIFIINYGSVLLNSLRNWKNLTMIWFFLKDI